MKKLLFYSMLLIASLSCEIEPIELHDHSRSSTLEPSGKEVLTQSKSMGNPPGQSGFVVSRDGEEILATLFIDFKAGLTASIGADNEGFCNPFPNFDALELIPIQEVDIPNDERRRQILSKGETYVEVYDGIINGFFCDFIANTPRLASGNAKFVLTDNDFEIYLRDDPKNSNAFGFNARGNLRDDNGDHVSFNAHYRVSWDGNDFASANEQSKISLR